MLSKFKSNKLNHCSFIFILNNILKINIDNNTFDICYISLPLFHSGFTTFLVCLRRNKT